MTGTTWKRWAATGGRVAALLMVIGVAACDNVEWGGLDVAVVPPPSQAGPTSTDVEAGDRLPEGPILYHVVRDSLGTVMVPVGEIADEELRPIATGDDPAAFGDRFITAFLREDAEFTLFHNGRRAGTLVVDSAAVPASGYCRALPRATGSLELSGSVEDATEFLAMARTQAPQGRMIPGGEIEVESRMQVVGNILAEQALRARGAPLPNWSRARRQLQPFPVSEARDLGFTATFLVDDELRAGNDDEGYSLYIVYTPRAQTGYDTVYVDFTSYTAEGKAAPRTLDFLDWDRDGNAELLLEVFGTSNSWYAAVGRDGDGWSRIFEDRCDPAPAPPPADTAARDTAGVDTMSAPATRPTRTPSTPTRRQPARARPAAPDTNTDPLSDIQPRVRLSEPGAAGSGGARRDSQPDTSGVRLRAPASR